MADATMFLELLLRDKESVLQHGLGVDVGLLVAGVLELAANHHFLARDADDDMHIRRIAGGLLVLVRHLDRDEAADDMVVEFLELVHMCLNGLLYLVGRFDINGSSARGGYPWGDFSRFL